MLLSVHALVRVGVCMAPVPPPSPGDPLSEAPAGRPGPST